jgi:serine/threonine protein phosphatase PrpC
MLAEIMSSGDAVAAVAERVVLSAIAQGATDNATAVVARIGAS